MRLTLDFAKPTTRILCVNGVEWNFEVQEKVPRRLLSIVEPKGVARSRVGL